MHRVKAIVALLLVCLAFFSSRSQATTLNELKVGVRILDFMTVPLRGRIPIAIIYDGGVKASVEDAQAIEGWLAPGVGSAKIDPVPILIDARLLDATFPFQVAIVASGSSAYFGPIYALAQKNHTLVISSDLDCVLGDKCTVGVSSTPRVEVIVNRAVATSCSVQFSEAFRMMVREY